MKPHNYHWTVDLPRGTRSWLSTGAIALAVIMTLHWSAQGAQLRRFAANRRLSGPYRATGSEYSAAVAGASG